MLFRYMKCNSMALTYIYIARSLEYRERIFFQLRAHTLVLCMFYSLFLRSKPASPYPFTSIVSIISCSMELSTQKS